MASRPVHSQTLVKEIPTEFFPGSYIGPEYFIEKMVVLGNIVVARKLDFLIK